MSSSFSPRTPKFLKGAFAIYAPDQEDSDPTVLSFQYNPEQIQRQLKHRAPRNEGQQGNDNTPQDMRRVVGPPIETLTMAIELSAVDALEVPKENALIAKNGLIPALSALELLMYAPSFQMEQNEKLANKGVVSVEPALLSMVILVLGASRVVPVHLTSFSVSEETFDTNLNPIQAKVNVSMQILTYLDVVDGNTRKVVDVFVAYQKRKEKLARDHNSQTQAGERTTNLLPE